MISFALISTMIIWIYTTNSPSESIVRNSVQALDSSSPNIEAGALRVRLHPWPQSFNPLTSQHRDLGLLSSLVHGQLLYHSQLDWTLQPGIAEKWEAKDDGKTYRFELDKRANFPDGSRVTPEDIKFTLTLLSDVKACRKCEILRAELGPIENVTTLPDENAVEVRMRNVHFSHLEKLGTLPIYQKKKFSSGDFNQDYEKTLWGAGPYEYDEKNSEPGSAIVLRRKIDHWIKKTAYFTGRHNFETVILKNIPNDAVAFRMFKKKALDLFYFDQASHQLWDRESNPSRRDPNITLVESDFERPRFWSGIALNMRRPLLNQLLFRRALQLSLNRDLIIRQTLGNHFKPVHGPFLSASKDDPSPKSMTFNLDEASKLLRQLGFTKKDSSGVLFREIDHAETKVKQYARVRILYASKGHDAWLETYKKDAGKLGIDIQNELVDWETARKRVGEFNFDAFIVGWGSSPTPEPSVLWHSSTAKHRNTSNLSGFSDPEVDRLIDLTRILSDKEERMRRFAEIEKRIVDAQPYVFRWSKKSHLVAYWKDRIRPMDKPLHQYSGNIQHEPFFLHWHPAF